MIQVIKALYKKYYPIKYLDISVLGLIKILWLCSINLNYEKLELLKLEEHDPNIGKERNHLTS